jgi:peptidoglycan hydrolase CwlO-like protein
VDELQSQIEDLDHQISEIPDFENPELDQAASERAQLQEEINTLE